MDMNLLTSICHVKDILKLVVKLSKNPNGLWGAIESATIKYVAICIRYVGVI